MNRFFILTFIFFAFVFSQASFAQSDYEKTQNFKTRYKQLEDAIKNAASIDECNVIGENIAKLKTDFTSDAVLLDKSLYPETFESSFTKIERALEVRKGDFTQIVELKTQVGTLQDQVSELSQQNEGLIVQIKQLQLKSTKDAQTIASLQKLVSQLKSNIAQRDELVRGLVDSLLAEFVKTPGTLNEVEKQAIFNKVDSGNLFYNIERTISDNIQFMKVTQTTPDDLSNMKKQYADFNKVWRQIGPKLADVYLNKRDKAAEIANIDNMFADWNSKINDEIWGQVNRLFREKQLPLLPFRNGGQFVNSVSSFVDDELKNLPVKGSSQAEKTFYMFTDSVYFKTVQPTWIPILIENNMMSSANKDTIEKRISTWKEKVAPASKWNWVYFVGGFIIIALLVAYFMKGRKKQPVSVEEKS
ncbi:MAG: DUF3450 domain-containing protein [Bacteroidetes bacterium]|nr:DUF3450 domain-containing protein [Bacteroidota bacterium]